MNLNQRKYPIAVALAVAAGAVVAFAMPAGAAVSIQSQSPPVSALSLANKAKLDANGAVVFTSVKYVCNPGGYASLTVTVTQAVDGAIASGSAYRSLELACTGAVQQITLPVTPTQRPFQRGIAFGQAVLEGCVPPACLTIRDEHNIEIV
jgi:hypothetical protein